MATSKIIITNVKNIDYSIMHVIDNDKVESREYDSDMDIFTFEDTKRNKLRKGNLMSVSLYDDLIVEGDEKFKILRMLSKG